MTALSSYPQNTQPYPLLTSESPEVKELCNLLLSDVSNLDFKGPVIHWVQISYVDKTINFQSTPFKIPHDLDKLSASFSTISTIAFMLSHSDTFSKDAFVAYIKKNHLTMGMSHLKSIHIIQLLASVVQYLKNQYNYFISDLPSTSSTGKLFQAQIDLSLNPLFQELKELYLAYTPSFSPKKTLQVTPLTTLAAAVLLRAPAATPETVPTTCLCQEMHTCFRDDLNTHPGITQLSPLLRQTPLIASIASSLSSMNLSLKESWTPGRLPLTLEDTPPYLSLLSLIPWAEYVPNQRKFFWIVKQQLTTNALTSAFLDATPCSIPLPILTRKITGPFNPEPYVKLQNAGINFLTVIEQLTPKDLSNLAPTLNFFFSSLIAILSRNERPLASQSSSSSIQSLMLHISLTLGLAPSLIQQSLSSSANLYLCMHKLKMHHDYMTKNIQWLKATIHINCEPWANDFIEEFKSILRTAQSKLLSHAQNCNITVNDSAPFKLSHHHQVLNPTLPLSSSKPSVSKKKMVSFHN